MRILIIYGLLMCSMTLPASPIPFAQQVHEITWMTEDYPPYNYLENGHITGVTIDKLLAMFAYMNINFSRDDIDIYPWPRAYRYLENKPKRCLFSMTYTTERAKKFYFVGPIVTNRISLIALDDGRYEQLPAAQLKIGVVRDDIGHILLREQGVSEDHFVFLSTGFEMVKMLSLQRVDAIAYGESIARFQFKRAGITTSKYHVVKVLKESYLGFACNKAVDKNLIEAMQHALEHINQTPKRPAV